MKITKGILKGILKSGFKGIGGIFGEKSRAKKLSTICPHVDKVFHNLYTKSG